MFCCDLQLPTKNFYTWRPPEGANLHGTCCRVGCRLWPFDRSNDPGNGLRRVRPCDGRDPGSDGLVSHWAIGPLGWLHKWCCILGVLDLSWNLSWKYGSLESEWSVRCAFSGDLQWDFTGLASFSLRSPPLNLTFSNANILRGGNAFIQTLVSDGMTILLWGNRISLEDGKLLAIAVVLANAWVD